MLTSKRKWAALTLQLPRRLESGRVSLKVVDYGEMEGASFRGKPSPYRLKIAVAYSGELELELIEWVSGETPGR